MSTTHPQVGAYLDDLARMLTDIDPGERDDILASVREHLDAEIGSGDGGDAVVHAALLRLGPPEQVAAEARGDSPSAAGGAPVPPAAPTGNPRWASVAVVATTLSTLPFLLGALLSRAVDLWRSTSIGWPESVGMFGLHPAEAAMLMVLSAPVWLVGLVCATVASGLTARTRAGLCLVGPLAFLTVWAATLWQSPPVASGVVGVVVLAAVAAFVVATVRRAWREAHANT